MCGQYLKEGCSKLKPIHLAERLDVDETTASAGLRPSKTNDKYA
jgi:hypothetical protein